MPAIKVRAITRCYYADQLQEPGAEFFLVDLKDGKGKVLFTAEQQFSQRSMELCNSPKAFNGMTAERAQAIADSKNEDNHNNKNLSADNVVRVVDLPNVFTAPGVDPAKVVI